MRRTQAPSQIQAGRSVSKADSKPFADASRSSLQVLNLLSNVVPINNKTSNLDGWSKDGVSISSASTAENGHSVDTDTTSPVKKCYNVVYSKQTKKKHKTWEGDGTVEINNGIAILKDENGFILGRSSKLKNINLEEGSQIFIGSKEVEVLNSHFIIDEIKNEICQNSSLSNTTNEIQTNNSQYLEKETNYSCKRPIKKLKTSDSVIPVSSKTDELLTMPKPDYSHQWKFNKEKLPITDVKLDFFLSKVLRSHQQEGVIFLYSCITSIRDANYSGAILADEMGLGKTLQCISLIWMLLKNGPYGGKPSIGRVLIVTPSSLVTNWLKEFRRWLGFQRLQPFIVNKKQKPSDYAKLPASLYPVMIISYEMLIRHYDCIKNIKFHLLICDEGHRLKNNQNRISQFLSQLDIKKRIILTGTPVQNNLQEFFTLIDFVNPGILGHYLEFKKHFETPIIAANEPDCEVEVKELCDERSRELIHRTNGFILRRTQEVVDQYLPSKQECVVICSPTQLQIKLYEAVVSFWEDSLCDVTSKVPHLNVITMLKKICNHPVLLRNKEDSNDDFLYEETLLTHLQNVLPTFAVENSGKMKTLELFLSELHKLNEKVVLISYFIQTLNLLEVLCNQKRYSFLRLDGNTPASVRSENVDLFNSTSSKYFIFLLSAKAGGVGLNLIGASRLILFDLDWNPASDLQAMSRIWRDGQKKNVYIYRFLTAGSIEEKIYQRQISKTFLSNTVVDIQNCSNARLSSEELKDLFSFKPECISLTHEMLMCDCEGNGIPESVILNKEKDDSDDSDGQLSIVNQQKGKNILKISELIEWEHYSRPIADNVLEKLCLKEAEDYISFIFRNECTESAEED